MTDSASKKSGNQQSGLAPCQTECPAGVDIPRFLRAVAEGRVNDAARISLDRLPLPAVLSRVCRHPCEQACKHSETGGPLSVCRIRRFVFDSVEFEAHPWPQPPDTGKRVAVIGSGPAGLSAAHYLRRLGHAVTIFEAAPMAGGMLRHGIPEYRLPPRVLKKEIDRIAEQGVEIRLRTALGHDTSVEDLKNEGFDAVLVAIGMGVGRKLQLDGIENDNVELGVEFLRAIASGAYPRDRLRDRFVLVIGGGNIAVDAARTAARLGAFNVKLVCLEAETEMPAFETDLDDARTERIEIINSWAPTEFKVTDNKVGGVLFRKCTSVYDASGEFAPEYDDEDTYEIEADQVIVAIGRQFDPELSSEIELDEHGLAPTESERFFAAGNLTLGPSTVVQAIASGRSSAESIDRHLGGSGQIPSILSPEEATDSVETDNGFSARKRVRAWSAPAAIRLASFNEIEKTLEPEAAQIEAGRCLQCDLELGSSPPPKEEHSDNRSSEDQLSEDQAPETPPPLNIELTEKELDNIPRGPGVYILLDETMTAVKIAGTPNLAQALAEELCLEAPAPFFEYVEDLFYNEREEKLLKEFVEAHGHEPGEQEW